MQSLVKSTIYFEALKDGELPSFPHSDTILSNANVVLKWYFWYCVSIISMFLWKKCTRKQCPVLVDVGLPDSVIISVPCVIILCERIMMPMKPDIEKLREKYISNPPEGITSTDIRRMSEDDLLDMDYYLNDDELDDDFGEEGFYIF